MARKGIREYHAKQLLGRILPDFGDKLALVTPDSDLGQLEQEHPWMKGAKLVVKPDQLFGKRGKHGLIGVNLDAKETGAWIKERMNKEVTVSGISDKLTHFLIEPFVKHDNEYYVAMRTALDKDVLYLSNQGGVDVEENWDQVISIEIPEGGQLDAALVQEKIKTRFPEEHVGILSDFVGKFYQFFLKGHFTYLELNPISIVDGKLIPLDTVAKVDDTASFECQDLWGRYEMPSPFGRVRTKEEAFVEKLDAKTGASLKLSILNPKGRIWTMVAGGGASVIYADTIADLGLGAELANYGEYSGDPNADLTYHYAKTILDLMTREKASGGKPKFLIIGGGIANFTDVAKTFTGIIQAIREYAEKMKQVDVQVWVRRGGPNYKVGLERMKKLGAELNLPIHVHGPETHMTNVVSMALGQGE